ncbi:hypothetical protein Bca52824_024242 [Brassica carinata]|uniref:F-box domain-containing protein n=1 Tax=Brassica carinata TaxID=52824 RepID=A0A8X8AUA0_BRACI|nr:hypothetical protein Bca52824_024242 [Brassica carinata]
MKTRRQHAAEEALTISRRSTQSPPVSIGNSETIPIDLIFEIFSRLPSKSIAKCRCVSKFWDSLLRREDFTELFITRSRARPQLFLSCLENEELFLFSIPQVQNRDVIPANYHTKFPSGRSSKIIGPVRGLVCLTHLRKYKRTASVICNPSTGQSLPLPNVKTRSTHVNSFLGFDPIGKQFKILSMTTMDYHNCEEHQVLTLGTRKLSWRKIECSVSHYFRHIIHGICINGVVYYVAGVNGPPMANGIVCFDVRSEKFSVINRDEEMALWSQSTLVNYKGTLGALLSDGFTEVNGETKCFELWVVVDAGKHEWSKHISISLPPLWKNIVADAKLFFVGVTGTDEIVLSPSYVSEPYYYASEPYYLYVYYYNIERNTIRRVEIQGMDAFQHCSVRISLNHVEDVNLLQYI